MKYLGAQVSPYSDWRQFVQSNNIQRSQLFPNIDLSADASNQRLS
ncbi:hypothetical protein [Photobacterium indicum]|nr:hypothetical protein [Photobacterium indicum]